jgi:hypothetical protein
VVLSLEARMLGCEKSKSVWEKYVRLISCVFLDVPLLMGINSVRIVGGHIPITTCAKGEMEWATTVKGAQDQVGTKA